MGKYSNVFSSTKWRLGEKVVLWLIKCLCPAVSFDKFMNNNFTSFCQLTLLRVKNVRATRVLNKDMLRKCTITRDKQLRKKELCDFRQRRSSKKSVQLQGRRKLFHGRGGLNKNVGHHDWPTKKNLAKMPKRSPLKNEI